MRVLLSLTLSFLLAPAAWAAGEKIQNLSATAVGSSISVRFEMAHAFDDQERVQALESGLPTSFTYVVEVFRDRPNWLDEGIGRSRIEVVTTFNSVTREYLLNYRRDRRLVRSETFSDRAALQARSEDRSLLYKRRIAGAQMRARQRTLIPHGEPTS